MKKIVHIVEAFGGGVFTYMVDLCNNLADDFEVYLLYSVRRQTPKNYLDYMDKRVRMIKIESFTRSIDLKKDFSAYKEVKARLKEINPDIVHLHSSKAGVLGRYIVNGNNTPLFYTPHGYSFLMENCSEKKRKAYEMVEKVCGKRKCMTIACSRGEFIQSKRVTNEATFISNGINVKALQEELSSVRINKKSDQAVAFTLGRIIEQKNPKQFNEIAKAFPNMKFVWIGDGDLRKYLTSPNIEITGWCSRAEALKKAMQYDIFLLPSLWEGLPISLLESMLMKKYCVVSDIIGNNDVVVDKHNGYLCQNTDDYKNAINRIINKSDSDIIESAYRDVINVYNTAVTVEQYKSLYNEQLAKIRQKDAVLNV